MLTADITKIPFAKLGYDLTKSVSVKMRTAIPFTKLKVRDFFRIYAFSYLIGIRQTKSIIFFQRSFIDVYLPTDTAAMGTFIRYAFKIVIISRRVKLHCIFSILLLPELYHNDRQ
jgi:hypothetical protein